MHLVAMSLEPLDDLDNDMEAILQLARDKNIGTVRLIAPSVFTGESRRCGDWSVRARLGSESSLGAGVRDSVAELGGADMSRRGKEK